MAGEGSGSREPGRRRGLGGNGAGWRGWASRQELGGWGLVGPGPGRDGLGWVVDERWCGLSCGGKASFVSRPDSRSHPSVASFSVYLMEGGDA